MLNELSAIEPYLECFRYYNAEWQTGRLAEWQNGSVADWQNDRRTQAPRFAFWPLACTPVLLHSSIHSLLHSFNSQHCDKHTSQALVFVPARCTHTLANIAIEGTSKVILAKYSGSAAYFCAPGWRVRLLVAPRPLELCGGWIAGLVDWGEVKAFVSTKPKQQVLCNYNNNNNNNKNSKNITNNNKGNAKSGTEGESELQRKRMKEAYLLFSSLKMG